MQVENTLLHQIFWNLSNCCQRLCIDSLMLTFLLFSLEQSCLFDVVSEFCLRAIISNKKISTLWIRGSSKFYAPPITKKKCIYVHMYICKLQGKILTPYKTNRKKISNNKQKIFRAPQWQAMTKSLPIFL